MALGIGGSTPQSELAKMNSMRHQAIPISPDEHHLRISKLRGLLADRNVDAFYLDATTNLRYFTGLACYPSKWLHGAIIIAEELLYVCPAFEEQKTRTSMVVEGDFILWQEHENPTAAVASGVLKLTASDNACLAIDDQTPFFTVDGLQKASPKISIVNGGGLIAECRRIKSDNELALLKQAKAITLQVQQSVARILYEGIDTRDVQTFLDDAHLAMGMDGRSTFRIVLFGEPTAYPHSVPYAQTLKEGDMVLIDTGSTLHGYNSDITRSYVFGESTARQRQIWELEQAAQLAISCAIPAMVARSLIQVPLQTKVINAIKRNSS